MQRVFRLVDTADLRPVGTKTTSGFERSVERHGILNPITVAEVPDDDGVIGLEIVDGNRRVRAAQLAGLDKIPAVVLKETSPRDRARLTLMSNHLRSGNFVTESTAVTALADSKQSVRRTAHALGISTVKLQGIFNKLENMPEAVRRAMYDDRIPVTSATAIAGWPPDLQDEIVAMLRGRRYLDSRTIDAAKKAYDERHPPARAARPATSGTAEPALQAPHQEWADTPPVPLDESGEPLPAPERRADPRPPVVRNGRGTTPTSNAHRSEAPPSDQPPAVLPRPDASEPEASPVDPRVFIARLDEALLELARETRAHNLSRAAWIDRTMRAWDLSEDVPS